MIGMPPYGHESGPANCGLRNGTWKLLRHGGDKPNAWTAPGYGLSPPSDATYAPLGPPLDCAAPSYSLNQYCIKAMRTCLPDVNRVLRNRLSIRFFANIVDGL